MATDDVTLTDEQEQTLALLKALGFARTDEQIAAYRAKLAEKSAGDRWAKIRERFNLPTRAA
jgi:hypothetical protein